MFQIPWQSQLFYHNRTHRVKNHADMNMNYTSTVNAQERQKNIKTRKERTVMKPKRKAM